MATEHRDIVIVGAGPAGSAAAKAAACAGLAPLLIEKDEFPGQTNPCGGLASYALVEKLGLGPDIVDHPIRRLFLRTDGELSEYSGKRPAYFSFRRSEFDAFLASSAVDRGAELLVSTRVTEVDPLRRLVTIRNRKTGLEREIRAQVIIFADGPRTLASRTFGIGHQADENTWMGLMLELEGAWGDAETVEITVDSTAEATGYFWVFPKRDRVHVGFGCVRHDRSRSLLEHVSRFIDDRSDLRGRRILMKQAGLVPVRPAQRLVAEGAMVVGDAAGLVNPLTGGGIAFALHSGDIAGRVAAAAVQRGRVDMATLASYRRQLLLTPHSLWLRAMVMWAKRLERVDASRRPAAYGRMLRHYFNFFHALRPIAELLLG